MRKIVMQTAFDPGVVFVPGVFDTDVRDSLWR